MKNTREIGKKGEALACRALKSMGYRIIDKNFGSREGEVDIIAERGGYVCFIEVKARASARFGFPEEAVTKAKQRRILQAARAFIEQRGIEGGDFRFDVVSVDLRSNRVTVIPNAFEADLGTG